MCRVSLSTTSLSPPPFSPRNSHCPPFPVAASLSITTPPPLDNTEFASFGQGGDAEVPSPAVPKSDEARAALSAALREHFLFAALAPTDLAACVDVMGALEVAAGEDIVVQGERGSRFFVMDSGSAEVRGEGGGGCGMVSMLLWLHACVVLCCVLLPTHGRALFARR